MSGEGALQSPCEAVWFELGPVPTVVSDPDGVILGVNRAFSALAGAGPAAGRPLSELLDVSAGAGEVAVVGDGGSVIRCRLIAAEIAEHDGAMLVVHQMVPLDRPAPVAADQRRSGASGPALDDLQGGLDLARAALTRAEANLDATRAELVRSESDLGATGADLAATRADLAATRADLAATRADLDRARTELERWAGLDARRGEFFAMVAHDIRAPLAVVVGFCSTLLTHGDRLDEALRTTALSAMARSADTISELVERFLDLARIEREGLQLAPEPLDLGALVREWVSAHQMEVAGHPLEVSVPGEELVVRGDGHRLAQVLTNLVDNAAKFSPAGAPIAVTVERVAGEAATRVAVSDAGAGVDQSPALFDRFNPGHHVSSGHGLGLHICQVLIEAHGGAIGVEPRSGGGSTFWFTLPTGV